MKVKIGDEFTLFGKPFRVRECEVVDNTKFYHLSGKSSNAYLVLTEEDLARVQ